MGTLPKDDHPIVQIADAAVVEAHGKILAALRAARGESKQTDFSALQFAIGAVGVAAGCRSDGEACAMFAHAIANAAGLVLCQQTDVVAARVAFDNLLDRCMAEIALDIERDQPPGGIQ